MSKVIWNTVNEYGYVESNTQVAKIVSIASADKAKPNGNGTASRPMTVIVKGHEHKGPQSALALDRHVVDYPDAFTVGKELLCNLRYRESDPNQEVTLAVSPNEAQERGARTTASDWDADVTPAKAATPKGIQVTEEVF